MALSDFCSSNNIILYALPPNTTHIMQPADVGAFKGLKSDFQKTVRSWQSLPENFGKAVTKFNFCSLLETVLYEKDRSEIIKNSFRKCGLYPFNPNAIDYSKCIQDILERNMELGSASQGSQFTKNDFKCAKAIISSLKFKFVERDINYQTLIDIIEKEEIDLEENLAETSIDTCSSSNIEGTYLIDSVGTLIKVSSTVSDSASEINNNDENLEAVKLNDPVLSLSLDPDTTLTLDTGADANEADIDADKMKENRPLEVNILQKSSAQLSPFTKHLFYPEPLKPIQIQSRQNKEKPPMSVSSIAWKQYYKTKEALEVEKRKLVEQNKEERLKKRMEREDKNKNRKPRPRKRKSVLRKPELKCPECEEEVLTDVEDDGLKNIGCDNCDNWFHLKCTPLASLTINEAEHQHFVCKFCPNTSS